MMQPDPGRDVGSILILVFQAFFHARQVDQLQHPAPVDIMTVPDGVRGIQDGILHQLHLLDPVPDQFQLHLQRIQHELRIQLADGQLPDVIQRKAEIL